MKKLILPFMATAVFATAEAQVTVNLPEETGLKTINVSHAPLANLLTAKNETELGLRRDTITVTGNKAFITLDTIGTCRYSIDFDDNTRSDFYAAPGETLTVTVSSISPLQYTVAGSPLMDGLSALEARLAPIEKRAAVLQSQPQPDMEALNALYTEYENTVADFIKADPASPAAVFALLNLNGEIFMELFKSLPASAAETPFYPFALRQRDQQARRIEAEKTRQAMESNQTPAPDFTLYDIDGKPFTFSSLRGKWVILDFWGSWCGWCIKGFPELKKAYEKYKDTVEIVGIDCRDTEQAWKSAVKRLELPWIHVYCPESDMKLLETYGVTGFPTKIIVNPEGKIVKIAVGEDPEFYIFLNSALGK